MPGIANLHITTDFVLYIRYVSSLICVMYHSSNLRSYLGTYLTGVLQWLISKSVQLFENAKYYTMGVSTRAHLISISPI